MYIYNGNKYDTTDTVSNKYLQVNSCGYQRNLKEYTVVRAQGRKDYHMLVVESGEYEIKYHGKMYTLKKGNIVLYYPDDEQWYRAVCTSASFWCHFTGNAIDEILNDACVCGGIFKCEASNVAFEAFSRLIKNYILHGISLLTSASFLEMMHYITKEEHKRISNNRHSVVDAAMEYIQKNYILPITLDTLANQIGYSKSRLSHLFTAQVGISPMQYLANIRINNAAEYLGSTDLAIAKIAELCGFNDALYFSKCFKKHSHISPKEFRQAFHN